MEATQKKPRRPAGYWEDETTIERELRAWIEKHGKFPTTDDLDRTKNKSLRAAIVRCRGMDHWREKLGFTSTRKPVDHWNEANVERELRAWIEKHGKFPTQEDLATNGTWGLGKAMAKIGFLAWRRRLGHELQKKPQGYWDSETNTERELRAWIEKNGKFPSGSDLYTHSSLRHAMQRHGGVHAWRARLGADIVKRKVGFWQSDTNIERELRAWIERHGRFPTGPDLDRTKQASLRGALTRNGVSSWRRRLGYGPVTSESLREHADVLACIILVLNITDTAAFWIELRKRWTVRELEDAIRAFRDGGERFKQLLAAAD